MFALNQPRVYLWMLVLVECVREVLCRQSQPNLDGLQLMPKKSQKGQLRAYQVGGANASQLQIPDDRLREFAFNVPKRCLTLSGQSLLTKWRLNWMHPMLSHRENLQTFKHKGCG